jgi:hypothetical protein
LTGVIERSDAAGERPVVASYCATFLKPEMLHIYRQISALERFRPFVIAQKREEPERFPFSPIDVVGKPATHFLRRFWFKQIRKAPWQISNSELTKLLAILDWRNAQLLHIYFGHIAVHLLPLILKWPRSAKRAIAPHLFRSDRRSFVTAHTKMAAIGGCFVSRRGCDGRHG